MKFTTINYLCLLLILAGCNKQDEPIKEGKIDWNKASVAVMESLRPKLLGSWRIKEIHVSPSPPSTSEIGIFKDTTLLNLATIDITRVNTSGIYLSSNDVTGVIRFKNEVYTVGFKMLATPDAFIGLCFIEYMN